MKREAELKSKFAAELKRRAPEMVTLLFSTAGAPDRMLIGNGTVSAWEFKHGTPRFLSPGIQELVCMRLAKHMHCRYVIWLESSRGEFPRTLIVHPEHVHDKTLTPEVEWAGYDIKSLVQHVLRIHAE